MKPAAFAYARPDTLDAALAMLAADPEARLLAGGQSLTPMLSMRLARPSLLIDVGRLPGLDSVAFEGGRVAVGALARHHDVARDPVVRQWLPLLAEAAGSIGFLAIRHRGTLGGSLAHADPAAQYVLLAAALEGTVTLASARGRRMTALCGFVEGPFATAAAPDEMILGVAFEPLLIGEGAAMRSFARRRGDYALAAVVAVARLADAGTVAALRLAIAGVGAAPVRFDAAGPFDAHARGWIAPLVADAAAGIEGVETGVDLAWRRRLARGLAEQAVAAALDAAQGTLA